MEDSSVDRKVKCPSCKKMTLYSKENPFRPFCSDRCRTNDLGAWASEAFRVPTEDRVDIDRKNTEGEDGE